MGFLLALALAMIVGLLPAYIAKSKGREFNTWWFYGALLFIIALPHAILIKPYDGTTHENLPNGLKKCPYCAEFVKREATLCRYCQKELPIEIMIKRIGKPHHYFSSGRWQCGVCDEVNDSGVESCKTCGTASEHKS